MKLKTTVGRLIFYAGWPLIYVVLRFGSPRTRIFVVVGNEVLLIKNLIGDNRWTLPGGGLRWRESPAHGAARELREELGLIIADAKLQLLAPEVVRLCHGGFQLRGWPLIVTLSTKPELKTRITEIAETTWVDISRLAQHADVSKGVLQLLPFFRMVKFAKIP